jgi:hypothetical protein
VVRDFEIVNNNDTSNNEDTDNDTSVNEDNIAEEEGDHPNGDYGLTKHGTVCKSCVKAQGRCRLHTLK